MDWLLIGKSIFALCAVIALIFACSKLLGRFNPAFKTMQNNNPENKLKIIDQLAVNPRGKIAVISWRKQEVMIAITANGISHIANIAEDQTANSPAPSTNE